MNRDLIKRLATLADCDARAGEPLGKCMREAAAALAEAQAEIARLEAELSAVWATLALFAKLDEASSRDQVWAAVRAARAALEARIQAMGKP